LSTIPVDVLYIIFSYLPSTIDFGRLCQVCKKFQQIITENESLWRFQCLKWWENHPLSRITDNGVKIDIVMKDCLELNQEKNWSWLGKCIATKDINSHYYYKNLPSEITLGDNIEMGWRIEIKPLCYRVGTFRDSEQIFGVRNTPSENRYEGDFGVGKGSYINFKDGYKYEGDWGEIDFNGNGIMTWENTGFVYEGQWIEGSPVDQEKCLHPALRDCISRGICTRSVTGKTSDYGQFLHYNRTLSDRVCAACNVSCYVGLKMEWESAGFCHCNTCGWK